MSTTGPTSDPEREGAGGLPPARPEESREAFLVEADAIGRSQGSSGTAVGGDPSELLEAETHRVSEDMTHAAQQRLAAEQRRQAQLATPPDVVGSAGAPSAGPSSSEPALPTEVHPATLRLPEALAFQRILVPLDGSARAERAVPVAARIALASRASVLLLQVVRPQVAGEAPFMPVDASMEASIDAADAYLHTVSHREELADLEAHHKVLAGISAGATLLDAIELYECDLVVLCSHGRSGLVRWALGSVAQQIVRRAIAPVLVLRPEATLSAVAGDAGDAGDASTPTVSALVPLDGSSLAEAALLPAARVVAALAGPGRGALHLLRVLNPATAAEPPLVLPYRDADEAAMEQARTHLYTVARRFNEGELAKLGLRISWSTSDDTDVAGAILDEAEGAAPDEKAPDDGQGASRPFDLIAMATHGRSGMKLWALGSVTDRVLQTTALPMLVVSPRWEHRARGDQQGRPI